MEYIQVTKDNLENEHICCAISNNKDAQVSSKKTWLSERFDDGLVFLKSVERGKCFIEYIPAKKAWNPIEAEDYMYIDCLWVSGSLKGHGYSTDLLEACIADSKAKGKNGLYILAAAADYKAAEKVLYEGAHYNPIYFRSTEWLQNPDLKNLVRNSTGLTVDFSHAYKK